MRRFGEISELANIDFRTSGDNKEVVIAPPTSLTAASNTLTTPNIAGTTDTLISRLSVDQGADRLHSKDLSADTVKVVDSSDVTKKLAFDLSGFTTATTNTLVIPDSSDTVVLLTETQILTNKSIDGDDNIITDLALASLKTTGNLNKFLQRDGSGNVIDSTKGVPTGDVVGTSDSQSLTNKSIDSDTNTITNITNSDIKAAAGILVNKIEALTINRALITDASGFNTASAVTSTELGYVSGVTSSIQSQFSGKQNDVITTEGDVIVGNVSGVGVRLGLGGSGTVLTSNGTTASWDSPAGTGDVTAAAIMADHTLIRGNGGAKGIQDSGIVIDDLDNITNIQTAQVEDGFFTKQENDSNFTVPLGYSMVNSNMTVTTGSTVTVVGFLDVFDVITTDGTLTVTGTTTIR